MVAKLDIPLVFNPADPSALKRDLERFAQGVSRYSKDAQQSFVGVPQPGVVGTLSFGMVTRVSLVFGATLILQLPQPDVKNGGLELYIKRELTTGTCTVRGVGALINGRATKLLPAAPGLYTIYFDGANYYSTPQLAADWGG